MPESARVSISIPAWTLSFCLLAVALPIRAQVCYEFSDSDGVQPATYTATVQISDIPASDPNNGTPGFVYKALFTSATALQTVPIYHYSAANTLTMSIAGGAKYTMDSSGILIAYAPPGVGMRNYISINGYQFLNTSGATITLSFLGPVGPNLFPNGLTATLPPGLIGDSMYFTAPGITKSSRIASFKSGCSAPASPSPAILSGGIQSAGAFGAFNSASPGSWIEIFGSSLAATVRSWTAADFNGLNAPTSLDGTKVTIGGKLAFVDYISPTQINALIPSDVPAGPQPITVTTPLGTSTPVTLTVSPAQPGILAPLTFKIGSTQYAVAILPDGLFALPAGAISGVASRPAKPGETIVLYGVGFGPVTPAIPAGQLVQQANSLTSSFQVSLGGISVQPAYFGLAPSFTGLYQFNLVVPNLLPGNAPLTFVLGGVSGAQILNIAVAN